MESPVVLDKPPEYHGNERGFPFEEEEGSGAWSELAARHPDIAARLRQRPATATWARKRRPSSQDTTDDFGENFSGFDSFPFDDIPPEFREHFPSHWNRRRFGPREEQQPQQSQQPQQQQQPQNSPPQQSTATQTELNPEPEPAESPALPTYGLRNTVDLGQRSPAEPGAHAERARCMSAPPEDMSAPQSQPPDHAHVRHIPIFVEGRDEPVINKTERKPTPPPPKPQPQPHVDREHYFADDGPASFHHPPNFSRAFGTPFNKGFRQGPQPFTQQKAYPQNAFRGGSPARAQSPARAPAQEQATRAPPQATPPQPEPPRQTSPPPPPPPKTSPNDPITQILAIQTDVLNLMSEVENFTGTKKDKRYIFLDEMLTRNLIKLDNIETEGKENIRLARKEAIRCIQKCIAVLEAKAEKGSAATQDVAMKDNTETPADSGEVEMKEDKPEAQAEVPTEQNGEVAQTQKEETSETKTTELEVPQPSQEQTNPSEKTEEQKVEENPSPKKKVVKKRDKSKDKAPEAAKDSNKVEESVEVMQVDNKGVSEQVMDVDGAASQ